VLDQGRGVGGHVGYQVGGGRRLGPSAASVVEGDDGVPGGGQVGHLGEPQVGRLTGAADEQDR
jgi:hypothetical protein